VPPNSTIHNSIALDRLRDNHNAAFCPETRTRTGLFIGTPHGRNHFFDLYEAAPSQPHWARFTFTTEQVGNVTREEMVRMREAFRPFAPAVSLEQVRRWFEVPAGAELPYMITTVDVRDEFRAQLPAITHVNGSARAQTVSASDNAEFHALLKAVGKISGREMVLNTSFNV
jgi:hypothetical protein